jgi:beta-aspartyl-peptidase (threonine type)
LLVLPKSHGGNWMEAAIIVHGGAGAWDIPSQWMKRAESDCALAALEGQKVLLAGGTAIDAVEAAVRVMEDSQALDAGRGSFLNAHGEIELDAMIMDGKTLALGSVAAIQRVRNPISLARRVMLDTEHNLLVGSGADQFADRIGFPRCDAADLLVDSGPRGSVTAEMGHALSSGTKAGSGASGDTVGAVAIDKNGNLAAGTSTGGTENKLPGRVGDSPLVGSGGYADNLTAAVSATGHGEDLMRVVISQRVCQYAGDGLSASAACEAAIRLLEHRVDGRGGLIAIDARGRVGKAFNTRAMPHAWAVGTQPVRSGR